MPHPRPAVWTWPFPGSSRAARRCTSRSDPVRCRPPARVHVQRWETATMRAGPSRLSETCPVRGLAMTCPSFGTGSAFHPIFTPRGDRAGPGPNFRRFRRLLETDRKGNGGGPDMDAWQKFEGTWQAVWLAEDGRKRTVEEGRRHEPSDLGRPLHAAPGRARLPGDRQTGGRHPPPWGCRFRGRRAGGRPGGTAGLCVLGDDELSLCVAPPGRERPTSFAARPGGNHSLCLLRRHVPSAARPVAGAMR